MIRRRHLILLGATSGAIAVLAVVAVTALRDSAERLDELYATVAEFSTPGGSITDEVNREMLRLQMTITTLEDVIGPLVLAVIVPVIGALVLVMLRRSPYRASASATALRDASSAAAASAGSAESIS